MYELGLPGWLLRIIASYLSGRKLIVKYGKSESEKRSIKGGSPQGILLGVICFIIQMNDLRALPMIPLEYMITPPGIR